jgi:Sec-independent protein translocase protein TatA
VISVSEIGMVLLVAFVVIKPEKLPEVAMKLGRIFIWLRQTKEKIRQEFVFPNLKNDDKHDAR